MTSQLVRSDLRKAEIPQTSGLQRAGLFILFLLCEAVIFIFGSHYFDAFPTNKNLTFNLSVSAIFLIVALWLKYDKRWSKYWQIAFAFFIASLGTPISALCDSWVRTIFGWLALTIDTSKGLAIEKICEMLIKSLPIIALVKLSGADMGSIFLKHGNLKLGLGVGALMFFFLAPSSFMFAAQRFTSMDTLLAAVIWGLVFSIANGFMEELWLRGLFLKRFEPMLGMHGSVWVTSIIFALMHGMAYYFMPAVLPFFVINTLALGLGCGYLMMKSDNIWGATVIHTASDFFLFVAVLANV